MRSWAGPFRHPSIPVLLRLRMLLFCSAHLTFGLLVVLSETYLEQFTSLRETSSVECDTP
jgi:hypothetical protein